MQIDLLKERIQATLTDAKIVIEGDGTHFTTLVISPLFQGQSRIRRQQMVYSAVREELIDGSLHALSIKALTPEEYENEQANH